MKKIFLFLLIVSLAHLEATSIHRYSYHNQHSLNSEQDAALMAFSAGALAVWAVPVMQNHALTNEWHAFTSGVFATGAGALGYAAAKLSANNNHEAATWSLLAATVIGGLYYKCYPNYSLKSALRNASACFNCNVEETTFSDVIYNAANAANSNNWNEFHSSISACGDLRSEHLFADSVDELISYRDKLKNVKNNLERLKPYSNFEHYVDTPISNADKSLSSLDAIIRAAKTTFKDEFDKRKRAQEAADQLKIDQAMAAAATRQSQADQQHAYAAHENAKANRMHAQNESSLVTLSWLEFFFGSRKK